MPITQDRMLALLQAAEELSEKISTLKGIAIEECSAALAGTQDWRTAASNITLRFDSIPTRGALIVLERERTKYLLTHRRNETKKNWMRDKRTGEGGQPMPRVLPERRVHLPDPERESAAAAAARIDAEEGLVPDGTGALRGEAQKLGVNLGREFSPEEATRLLAEGAEVIAKEIKAARYTLNDRTASPEAKAEARAFLATQPGEPEAQAEAEAKSESNITVLELPEAPE